MCHDPPNLCLSFSSGIQFVEPRSLRKIIVEDDNLVVINVVSGKWTTPWIIKDEIEENKRLLHSF